LFLILDTIFYFGSPGAARYLVFQQYLELGFIVILIGFAIGLCVSVQRRWLGLVLTLAFLLISYNMIDVRLGQVQPNAKAFSAQATWMNSVSRGFHERLTGIAELSERSNEAPIVLHVTDPINEWEATASLATFLTLIYSRHVYMVLDRPDIGINGPPDSSRSKLGYKPWNVRPLSDLGDERSKVAICIKDLANSQEAYECDPPAHSS
jgi:hypothetical protein